MRHARKHQPVRRPGHPAPRAAAILFPGECRTRWRALSERFDECASFWQCESSRFRWQLTNCQTRQVRSNGANATESLQRTSAGRRHATNACRVPEPTGARLGLTVMQQPQPVSTSQQSSCIAASWPATRQNDCLAQRRATHVPGSVESADDFASRVQPRERSSPHVVHTHRSVHPQPAVR
jgi:hypothetical protein